MVAYYACDITEDWKGSSGSGYLNQIVNLEDEFFVSIEKWIMLKGSIQVYLKSCLNMTWYDGTLQIFTFFSGNPRFLEKALKTFRKGILLCICQREPEPFS